MDMLDRATGCLLGLAVGDALGFPLEGLGRRQIQSRFGRPSGYRFLGATGYVSDDTEQAVMAAEAALEAGLVPEEAARRFARKLVGWFWTLPPGVGLATVRACLKWSVGLGGGVASAGNGSAMRAAPLGLVPGSGGELVAAISRVTHTDPRAVDGARVMAAAAGLLVRGGSAGLDELLEATSPLDPRLEEALRGAWQLATSGAPARQAAERLGVSGYVLHSVPFAFWALWRRPHSFIEGLQSVVFQGGDADSNGAMAGALLGAWKGRDSIPSDLVEALEPAYGAGRLGLLARGLVEGSLPPGYRPPGFAAARRRELAVKLGVGLHALRRLLPWPLPAADPGAEP
ncbi:MAG: ADP-ribosylglycohydrolase family protein [Armatimonadetes bacterium]|nr:ADP-ribosylglycohydrolase family protein [Armatimonadota bacterium]